MNTPPDSAPLRAVPMNTLPDSAPLSAVPMNTPPDSAPPNIPNDLLVEILSHLPVKSLLRFQCTSKSWKSLISHPKFIKLHLQKSPKNVNIVLLCDFVKSGFDPLAISCKIRSLIKCPTLEFAEYDCCYRLKPDYWVVDCFNGLFCLRKTRNVRRGFNEHWVRFWNPAMKKKSAKSPCLRVKRINCRPESCRFGFGYDDLTDSYKVVAAVFGRKKTEVKLYCMGDTCWRTILSFPVFPFLNQIDGMFMKGTINWLALNKPGSDYCWKSDVTANQLVIFSLDLGNETYQHISLPEGFVEVPRFEPQLRVSKDTLCLFHDQGSHFVMWQMKEFGVESSWTKLVNFDSNGFPLVPICISDKDIAILVNNQYVEAILYNLRREVVVGTKFHSYETWMDAKDYIQSLVFPCEE
ncbi:hypothetical protein VNO77_19585 [Canavalia gladiata]|uniref:F-box domain-containing protein n=1 Tax=Canavalia gladiata TaxID=3824 RepID=A0AAN9LNN6_CANGL